jgi:hypothetical protein
MAFADIAAIRARAALPPETTVITVDGWGAFQAQRINLQQKQEMGAAIRANDGRMGLDAAQILLAAAIVAPELSAEDITLLWHHPDTALSLEALVNQVAEWCQATPGAAAEAVDDARDGFPDRPDGAEPPASGGVGSVRNGVVPADRGDDPDRDAGADGPDRVSPLDGLQVSASAA